MSITVSQIAELRAQTGAGMLDCKNALTEANGDMDRAGEILREKGIAKAAKRAGKIAAEGLVYSYIHGDGKIGVLLELNCETDFVAKTDGFKALAHDLGMHIVATNPKYLSREDVATEDLEKEKEIYRVQLTNEGKPAEMIEKILEGKMGKYYSEVCVLEQPFIKDEDMIIEQLLTRRTGEMGEKISLRRFARYELGEGIAKKACDYAAEVEEQLNK